MPGFGISGLGSSLPFGFAEALNRKYNILQQQADAGSFNADTNRIGTVAAAGLDRARTGVIPAESEASIANTIANTNLTSETARLLPEDTRSQINLRRAQGGLLSAQTDEQKKSTEVSFRERRTDPDILRRLLGDKLPTFTGLDYGR